MITTLPIWAIFVILAMVLLDLTWWVHMYLKYSLEEKRMKYGYKGDSPEQERDPYSGTPEGREGARR